MTRTLICVLFLALLAMVSLAGCVEESATDVAPSPSPAGLKAWVDNAALFAQERGEEAALAEFSDPNGDYVHGDWYIYAYDYEGILLAHPFEEAKVGTSRINWTTANGLRFFELGVDKAKSGGGFVLYMYPRPEGSGTINESDADLYELKLGYVAPAGAGWWIGSGFYLSEAEETGLPSKVANDLADYVDSAAVYAQAHGKEEALSAINDPEGPFAVENRYIFALDYNGTVLAYPPDPSELGMSHLGVVRAYGVKSADTSIDLARKGGGYLVYSIKNPDTGRVEQKLSFVRPVDDTWWLGSGVYESELLKEGC